MPRSLMILAIVVASILSVVITADIALRTTDSGGDDDTPTEAATPADDTGVSVIVVGKSEPNLLTNDWCITYQIGGQRGGECKPESIEVRGCFAMAKIGDELPSCWR